MAYMQSPNTYQWLYDTNTVTSSGTASTIAIYPSYPSPPPARRKPKKAPAVVVDTDMDWLRGRVDEICKLGELKAA